MSDRSVEAKIKRLEREISEINDHVYSDSSGSRDLHAGMLERKRDDVIRAAVLQMHTAIEDILDQLIMCRILGATAESVRRVRTAPAQALRRIMMDNGSIGFERKLNLAVALKIMNTTRRKRLSVLNTLRNKCSHHWLLRMKVRRGRSPRKLKPPLLR
jgi:hypothetical protein